MRKLHKRYKVFLIVLSVITLPYLGFGAVYVYNCTKSERPAYCNKDSQQSQSSDNTTSQSGLSDWSKTSLQTLNTQKVSPQTTTPTSTSGTNPQASTDHIPLVLFSPPQINLTGPPVASTPYSTDPFYTCKDIQIPDSSFTRQVCGYPGQPAQQTCKQIWMFGGPTGLYECHY